MMQVTLRDSSYRRKTDSGGRGLASVPSHINMSTPPATLPPPAPCCFTAAGASSGRTATTCVTYQLVVKHVKELATSRQD